MSTQPRGPASKVRWRLLIVPFVVVGLIVVAALAWVWGVDSPQRQQPLHRTLLVVAGAALLLGLWLLVWLLFLSRLRPRARLTWLGLLVLLCLFPVLTLEVKGLTGDAMPILGWRWTGNPVEPPSVPVLETSAGGDPAPVDTGHDYPQFLGPRRDGTVTEVRLARAWPERMTPLWRQGIGAGWSGFAVVGTYAVTQEQRGSQEAVSCYDLMTGALLWIHTTETRWEDPLGGAGPRATPAIRDGRVYALGGTGWLHALDLVSGRLIWSRNVVEESGAEPPTYGVASSPLILGKAVVVLAGGSAGNSLVAYDREDGALLWAGGDDPASYSSPVLAELMGRPQILLLTGKNVVGHDAANGSLLWSYPWPATERVSQVLVLPGEQMFVSSGYGVGAKLLALQGEAATGFEPRLIWESQAMKAKFTNVVYREGHLYGLDDGILACIDATEGRRQWKGGRYGHGQLMLVHDLLLVLGERGVVALVEARPDGYRELASFPALEGKSWNHAALAGSLLLVRNDREAACYELPLEQPGKSDAEAP